MKKMFIALLAIVSLSAIASPGEVAFDVKITRGDAMVWTANVIVADGDRAPFSVLKETAYVESAARDGDGIKPVTGLAKTGISAAFSPQIESTGQIKARVTMGLSELKGMATVKTADGLEVQVPDIVAREMDQVITFDKDHPSLHEMGEYSIQIAAKTL